MRYFALYFSLCCALVAAGVTKVGGSGTTRVGGSGTTKVSGVVSVGVTPPTFIQTAATPGWSSNAALTTSSFAVQVGDQLVLGIITDNFDASTPTVTNSGTALTWTPGTSVQLANNCSVYTYTAPCIAAESITVGINITGLSGTWGAEVSTWRGSGGIGATAGINGTGAPSLALVNTGNNSAIVMFDGDWAAGSGASRAYRTVNSITPTPGGSGELFYDASGVGSTYVVYGAYWSNAGTAGSKTVGLTAPSQTFAIAAVEVKGI